MDNCKCKGEFIKEPMGIRQIGPRTVIKPADPIIWDAHSSYEYLTLVSSEDFGQAYISKRDVPSGTPLSDAEYWIPAAKFNAQLAKLQLDMEKLGVRVDRAAHVVDLSGKRAVFLGDSLTTCRNDGEISRPWPELFSSLTGCEVRNIAVGGASAADIDIAPSTAWKQSRQVTSGFDYAFMMFGTNDYGYGSAAPLGKVGTSDKKTVYGGLGESIRYLQGKYPYMKIIGIIPPYMPGDNVVKDGRTALDVKGAIVEAYTAFNVPYIDLTHGMGYTEANWDDHLADWDKGNSRLHPNQETYDAIGEYIAQALSVNSFGLWHGNFIREGSNLGLSPQDGTNVITDNEGPIIVKDGMTGNVYIDFGSGFNTNATNEKVFKLPFSNIYRNFYFTITAYEQKNPASDKPILGCVTKDTGDGSYIQIIGSSNVQQGLNMYGCVTVPFYYF